MSLETEREQLLRDIERLETRLEQLRQQFAVKRTNDLRDRMKTMNGLIRDAYFTLREMCIRDSPYTGCSGCFPRTRCQSCTGCRARAPPGKDKFSAYSDPPFPDGWPADGVPAVFSGTR